MSFGKRVIKNGIFALYSGAARLRGKGAERIVVLLYHRVNDALRDSVTVGVKQFENHIRYLADHYEIQRLEDVISSGASTARPLVAITFDDGYLDNYEYAAPILARHGVHATFFVATDHVGDNLPFAHDLHKLGYGLPNMNWDQIREMQSEGFSFGSHTARHANLAQLDAEAARGELTRSKAALERELGLDRVMFAYPFGKKEDITPQRAQQIREIGYVCNCSAYGGVNDWPVDRWNIRRIGINHEFDIPALAARIAGWKASAGAR
jgi:peptidoglycan/xylan/chitin deacetylase (PgdA/CDA1 family)